MFDPKETPLTDGERSKFETMLQAIQTFPQEIALMRVVMDGEPTAAIVWAEPLPDGSIEVRPMALLLDDRLFARIQTPSEAEVVEP